MRRVLEEIFLCIFTKLDNCVVVKEEEGRMYFWYENKCYRVTVEEV